MLNKAAPGLSSMLPGHLSPTVRAALTDAAAALRDRYGTRLRHLVLFGSQARGDTHSESDVDLLVVLSEPFHLYDEIKHVVDIELELFGRYGCLLAFTLLPESRYESPHHPLMMNVRQEGVEL